MSGFQVPEQRPSPSGPGGASSDRDIETGARIQRALLTGRRAGGPAGIDFYAEAIPSSRIDGDFYDSISMSPVTLDFMIGDVMGKGIPAALTAAATKSAVYRSLVRHLAGSSTLPDPTDIMTGVDHALSGNLSDVGTFVTLDYCRIDTARRLLCFVDAGHTGFCFFDASDGTCWIVKGSNMPLGFKVGQAWRRYLIPLDSGDMFFFYSDGISEAEDFEGTRFGEERIRQLVMAHSGLSAEEFVKRTLNIMFFFARNGFSDDVTALAVRVVSSELERLPRRFYRASIAREDSNCIIDLRLRFSAFLAAEFPDAGKDLLNALELGFVEAVSNVLKHTSGESGLRWSVFSGVLCVELEYISGEYDWFAFCRPNIAAYPENGFGTFIMNEAFDSLALLHGKDDGRRLVMVANIAEKRRA